MQKVAKDRPYRVVIVGGGIGGLTAAVALHQRGFEVAVYERSPKLEEVGAGLQVGPNGVKVIRALGLWDRFSKFAFRPATQVSIKWDDASLRHRTPLKGVAERDYGAPHTTLHRAHLHELLRNQLPERAIHLNSNCVGAISTEDSAVARFADGLEIEADAVIGADGIRSAIRAQLFGADNPRFTEQMCWRCMVPMERVPTRIGPGLSVELARDDYHGWIGPNGHVICYPIGDGSMLNIFAGHVTDQWVEESWSAPSSQEELLAAYEGWNEALLDMFRNVQHVFKWGIYDRDPIPQWTRGRVTLLGRRRASDHADAGAGRQHGDRGRLCARPQSRPPSRRHPCRAERLRRRAAAAHGARHVAVARTIHQQSQGAAAAVPGPHLDFHVRRHQGTGGSAGIANCNQLGRKR